MEVTVGSVPVGQMFRTIHTRRNGSVLDQLWGGRVVVVLLDPLRPGGRAQEKRLPAQIRVFALTEGVHWP